MRIRPPPSARRIANSLRRARPRASSIDARFRHTVRSTAPVMPIITAPSVASTPSFMGDVLVPNFGSGPSDKTWCSYSGKDRATPWPSRSRPAEAVDISMPSFTRPTRNRL